MKIEKKKGFALLQIILLIVLALGIAGTGWYVWQSKNKTNKVSDTATQSSENAIKTNTNITDFESCKNAGYPIQTSYPEVCVTKDGKRFTNPTQTTKSDPYTGWKTYTTKYDKMTFKYPTDMVVTDTSHATVAGEDNVTPGVDTVKISGSTGFTISIQAGLDGIGGGCPECQAKFSDPVTIAGKAFYMNYIDSGSGNIQNIAVASDQTSFIGNLGTHNIVITGTTNKAGTIVSGSFRDASDNIVGKSLTEYKADHFIAEFKLLLQSISY